MQLRKRLAKKRISSQQIKSEKLMPASGMPMLNNATGLAGGIHTLPPLSERGAYLSASPVVSGASSPDANPLGSVFNPSIIPRSKWVLLQKGSENGTAFKAKLIRYGVNSVVDSIVIDTNTVLL